MVKTTECFRIFKTLRMVRDCIQRKAGMPALYPQDLGFVTKTRTKLLRENKVFDQKILIISS
jgi:hypothetical protein